jgi:aspartate ammonia-lyase
MKEAKLDPRLRFLHEQSATQRASFAESIGLVTALSPQLGYEQASAIAQEAQLTGRGAVELVLEQGLLTREQIDAALSPDALAGLRGKNHVITG